MSKSSLVILGNGTQGLGIVRSAGTSNLPIIQINDKYISAARFSKFINRYIKLKPNFLSKISFDTDSANELLEILLNLSVSYPSIILGTNEDLNRFIYNNKSILKEKYFIPENEYELIFDKFLFNDKLPKENQIETYIATEEVYSKFKKSNYLLKGRQGNRFKILTGKKAILLKDINGLYFKKISQDIGSENIVVQKVVEGNFPVQSVCTFSENGEIKGLFIYEKLRQHPDKFGTGTYLRSIQNDEVLKIAEGILNRVKYTGISEIEFIIDPNDNKFKVIEMNPRTWKSINFATQCNQNIVQKYIALVRGEDITKDNYYDLDQYWADIFADVSQMVRERKLFPYKLSNLYECTWERKDPLPFIASIILLPLIAFKI